jgi:ubiquinol-cytochrome c reductase iron-sulfur subunit
VELALVYRALFIRSDWERSGVNTKNVTENTLAGSSRRDILYIATGAAATVAAGGMVWPLISQMNPDASTLALASTEVDLSTIALGQIVTVKWRGKPVFVRHRTPQEIKAAEDVPLAELPDPEADSKRVQKPEWLVIIGVCTHLGCIPTGKSGEYDGWFCPCHGSTYDVSGRIRSGPAPSNLEVPKYAFVSDTKIKIG